MPKREPRHFMEVAYSQSRSISVSMKALGFLVEFGRTCDQLGRQVLIDEYADHIGLSRAEGFRRQAAFRQCFPNDDVLDTWNIVRPLLDGRKMQSRSITEQAIYVGALVWNPSRYAK